MRGCLLHLLSALALTIALLPTAGANAAALRPLALGLTTARSNSGPLSLGFSYPINCGQLCRGCAQAFSTPSCAGGGRHASPIRLGVALRAPLLPVPDVRIISGTLGIQSDPLLRPPRV